MTGYRLKKIRSALAAALRAHRRTQSSLRDSEPLRKAFNACQLSVARLTALMEDPGQDVSEEEQRLYRYASKALAIVDAASGRVSVLRQRTRELHNEVEQAVR